jgi:hypothetical protein
MSAAGSWPRMTASLAWPPANVTLITPAPSAAASTTWLLVRIVPSERKITPEPSPEPLDVVTMIVTTLGKATAAARASCWLVAVVELCPDGGVDVVTVVVPS